MKKILLSFIIVVSVTTLTAQVGINTNDPKTTLEVVGISSDVAVPDGIIAPKITRAELIAKTAYGTNQTGAILYITDLSGTINAATVNILETGYYFYNGTVWNSMHSGAKTNYGDTKQGLQSSDHNGWIKLDGRAINTLTAGQQTQALALGLSGNLSHVKLEGSEIESSIYQSDFGWATGDVPFPDVLLQGISNGVVYSNPNFTLSGAKYIIEWETGYETTNYSFLHLNLNGSPYRGDAKYSQAGAGGASHYVGSTIRTAVIDARTVNQVIKFNGRVGVATIKITKLENAGKSEFIYLGN